VDNGTSASTPPARAKQTVARASNTKITITLNNYQNDDSSINISVSIKQLFNASSNGVETKHVINTIVLTISLSAKTNYLMVMMYTPDMPGSQLSITM
jgi:hypothetical protein